eukprot:GFYU01000109.1.p1 GENE.GFYU01000109.1~~GFYU01000109.1.p1  ORF type:complete len:173 (+),score=51.97 GFYU01000109.1:310-828(+)
MPERLLSGNTMATTTNTPAAVTGQSASVPSTGATTPTHGSESSQNVRMSAATTVRSSDGSGKKEIPTIVEDLRVIKKQRRLQKNRLSAQRSRENKKNYIQTLEAEKEQMEEKTVELQRALGQLKQNQNSQKKTLFALKCLATVIAKKSDGPDVTTEPSHDNSNTNMTDGEAS